MKLKEIKLSSFRSHHQTVASDLRQINFFCGLNNAGKSSILDAISLALTGTCRGADAGVGLGLLRTIADGKKVTKNWAVGVYTEDGEGYERMEGEGPRSKVGVDIAQRVGLRPSAIRACLYAGELARMQPSEAQAILLALAGEKRVALPDELSPVAGLSTVTQLECEAMYKQFYDERRDMRRRLKERAVQPEPPEEFAADLTGANLEQVSEFVAKLRNVKDETVGRLENASKLQQRRRTLLEEKHRYGAILERAGDGIPKADDIYEKTKDLVAKINDGEQVNREKEEKRREIEKALASLRGELQNVETQISNVEAIRGEGRCSQCNRKLTPAAKKKILADLTKQKEAIFREAQPHKMAQKNLGDLADVGELQRELARLEGQEERLTEIRKTIEESEVALKNIQKELGDLIVPTPEAINEDKERKAEIERRITLLTRHEGALFSYKAACKQDEGLVDELKRVEALVDALAPGGPVREKFTDDADDFTAAVNAILGSLGFEADISPLIKKQGHVMVNDRPLPLLSTSEQMRFSAAFAVALSKQLGLGFVAVDGWELLQFAARYTTQEMLMTCGLQVLIFATLRQMDKDDTDETILAKSRKLFAASNKKDNGVASYYLVTNDDGQSVIERPMEVTPNA